MEKVTVGRVVHYHCEPDLTPMAALVVSASATIPGIADLVVFDRAGFFWKHDVPFSEKPDYSCWSWPPRAGTVSRG